MPTLIRAARKARVKLVVVGTGPLENALKEAASGADVAFPGFQSDKALWDLVRGARAIVLPSEWYENAPMSVLEAYACGKPVIGADIGGIPEMITAGETGWLFPSGDSDALMELLSEVQGTSNETLVRMGRAARELVVTRFTRSRYEREMLELYGALMATQTKMIARGI